MRNETLGLRIDEATKEFFSGITHYLEILLKYHKVKLTKTKIEKFNEGVKSITFTLKSRDKIVHAIIIVNPARDSFSVTLEFPGNNFKEKFSIDKTSNNTVCDKLGKHCLRIFEKEV